SNSMIFKTLHVHGRSGWCKFLQDLPCAKFVFSSEALDKLRLKVRPSQGVDLHLVGSKELVLYNAHRCHLQIGQPRHQIPSLSHYPPIELRVFGTYHDQVDVRTCLELWKISCVHESKLMIIKDFELVATYIDW